MKKLLTAALLFLSITSINFSQSENNSVVLENISKLNFDETVQYISDKAVEKGWKIPIIHDLQKSVAKDGYDVLPVKVIEICNPHFASKILENDQSRIISPLMPLRLSVYKNSKDEVIIARFNPEMVSKMFGGVAEETMLKACATSEEIVKDIIL